MDRRRSIRSKWHETAENRGLSLTRSYGYGVMMARLLALMGILGLALAPLLPGQQLFRCAMDGRLHTTCCCPMAPAHGHDHGQKPGGCCTVITLQVQLAAATAPAQVAVTQQLSVDLHLDTPHLDHVLCWLPRARCAPAPEPPWPCGRLFVRHCALLM